LIDTLLYLHVVDMMLW